jgi:hypothetical protein
MNWKQFTILIKNSLSNDLLNVQYRKIKEQHSEADVAFGHCYVATEAAYYLLGGKETGWSPQFVRVAGYAHWYLRHQSGFIFDPTSSQFKVPVPYHLGKGKGFLSKLPSKRCKQLLKRIEDSPTWAYLKK